MKVGALYLNNKTLEYSVGIADHYFLRLRGLIGRNVKELGGLWIVPCNQIHMFFMKEPIDAVYLSKNGTVLKIEADIPTGTICKPVRSCRQVLELPAGMAEQLFIHCGDTVTIVPIKAK